MGCKELIRISTETKDKLDYKKVHKRETYEDIINRLMENNNMEEDDGRE